MITHWMVTVPKDRINSYKQELQDAKLQALNKNFKIPPNVKNPKQGDVVHVVYSGAIRGCMIIKENTIIDKPFACKTTDRIMEPGRYIVCDLSNYVGHKEPFHLFTGFQGIRKLDPEKYKQIIKDSLLKLIKPV